MYTTSTDKMSGLIVTAKSFQTILKKKKLDIAREIERFKEHGIDPGYTLEDAMENELNKVAEDFRMQCRLAVKLRNIAMEEGLIKNDGDGTPRLEDSPALIGQYCLITVRPVAGTCLVYFEKAIATFMERPFIIGAEYHFEQVGTTPETMGDGFHCHMILHTKSSKRANEIMKDLRGDLECECSIQMGKEIGKKKYYFLKTEKDLEYALNYIRGDKHDDEKTDAVELNSEWRRINMLEDVYYIREWDNRESRPDAVIIEEVH